MIIGIDIDGVLVDLYGCCKKEFFKFSKKVNGKKVFNKNAVHLYEMFGLTLSQDQEFWNGFIWEYSQKVKVYKDAVKYLKLLRNNGHSLYIVTARSFAGRDDEDGRRMRNIVENMFKKHGVVYDKIIYTSEFRSKLPALKEHGVDVMIDDSVTNVQDIAPYVSTIIYTQKYNKMFKKENLRRANNWRDVYKIIKNIALIGKKEVEN